MNEFIINDFLTLKLEEGKTNIYVNGELFIHCKYLMLNNPVKKIQKFDEIDSIDEVADLLGWWDGGQEGVEYEIDQETEFWGHCSNLQVWYEHKYDTHLLHSNLSFSLLKQLSKVGDPIAKRVLNKEVTKRFSAGYPTTISYIFEEKLLELFSPEEQTQLLMDLFDRMLKRDFDGYVFLFSSFFKSFRRLNLIKLINFEELIEKTENGHFLMGLIESAQGSGLIENNLLSVLEKIEQISNKYTQTKAIFALILNVNYTHPRFVESFPTFLDRFSKVLTKIEEPTFFFSTLIDKTGKSGLLEEHSRTFIKIIEENSKIMRTKEIYHKLSEYVPINGIKKRNNLI